MSDDSADTPAPLTLTEYQRLAGRTINGSLSVDQRLLDASAGLAEEAGEVLGLVRKHLFMHHDLDSFDDDSQRRLHESFRPVGC